MGQITQLRQVEKQLTQALARSMGNMERAEIVTKCAMRELGTIQEFAIEEVAITLKTADELVASARYARLITNVTERQLVSHTEAYLSSMLHITHRAGERLATLLLSG
ncbi:MAG: hypothetical protein KDE50_09865 [Caldilineaceae bacterium]|nr:hypothetical protein [Caldilineaceae bacterium]MCB0140201.1 hypothetical protein [Caldilineaceae bacterium]